MKLRSSVRLTLSNQGNMSVPSQDGASNAQTVQHEIIHKRPAIIKYPGRVNGICTDVETFIESLECHLATLRNASESDKVAEAKAHFDLSKGDLKNFCASGEFRGIKYLGSTEEIFTKSVWGCK